MVSARPHCSHQKFVQKQLLQYFVGCVVCCAADVATMKEFICHGHCVMRVNLGRPVRHGHPAGRWQDLCSTFAHPVCLPTQRNDRPAALVRSRRSQPRKEMLVTCEYYVELRGTDEKRWTTSCHRILPPPPLPRKRASPDATRSYREIRSSASCWMWDMLLMNVYGEDMYNRFFF